MSLLVLLKPHGTATVAPPETPTLPPPKPGSKKQRPPLVLHHVRAGKPVLHFRAYPPRLLLVSSAGRARGSIRSFAPGYRLVLQSPARRLPRTYRAMRDERDFDELVQTAYLLSR